MIAIAYYLLKVLICSGILFLYYQFALKNKIFHQWNRFYLLAAVALSLSLPLLQITIDHPAQHEENKTVDFILFMQSADHSLEEFTVASSSSISSEQWIMLVYSCFCVLLFASVLLSIFKIAKLIKTHTVQLVDDIKFINTKEPDAPFSFLRYIFWNDNISLESETGKQIFQHELIHVREKHTLDKLFIQTILIFFWCNPFFWLIRRELKFIHEFIADKKAVGQQGTEAFAAMIVQAAYPKHYHAITNQFFQTSIKRRLSMLTKIQNPRVAYISRIVALPLIAITIFAFTVRTNNTASNPLSKGDTDLFMPQANDTIPKNKKQITAVNVRKDKEKKISELTITYEDGSVETLTEQEATKRGLINNGGYVNKKRSEGKNLPSESQWATASLPQAIFILDGKQVQKADIERIDAQTIESVNVLKGQPAINKYGEKGKTGVIEVNTKSKSSDGQITIQENGKVIGTGKIESGNDLSEIKGTFDINVSEKDNKIFVKAEFPPSVDKDEWRRFMERNLMPIVEGMASKGARAGNYVTEVEFIVEKDGSLSDIKVVNHPGYDLDKKVLNIMKDSPKWKPAIQNGRAVRAYHKQPVTVVISNG